MKFVSRLLILVLMMVPTVVLADGNDDDYYYDDDDDSVVSFDCTLICQFADLCGGVSCVSSDECVPYCLEKYGSGSMSFDSSSCSSAEKVLCTASADDDDSDNTDDDDADTDSKPTSDDDDDDSTCGVSNQATGVAMTAFMVLIGLAALAVGVRKQQ